MNKKKILWWGFIDAVVVAVYTSVVAWMLFNMDAVFGRGEDSVWAPVLFLLLFVCSAAIVGALIFGRPILLYLAGKKHEGIAVFLTSVVVFVFIAFFIILSQL